MTAPPPTLLDQFAEGWRGYVLVALIALASSLFGAASMQVLDGDEARFVQATRQMVETGDYVSIRLPDEEQRSTPIGIHWLQAFSVNATLPLTQQVNSIWPYRLPSVLGIALAAVAALWAGRALIGDRGALFGAGLFAAGVLVGLEGMTATTDAALLGFTTLAMAALAHLYGRGAHGRRFAILFWFALACGVLMKGPVTPLTVALALLTLGLWERRWRWMKPLLWWPGPALAAVMVLPWVVAVSSATDGRFFLDMFIEDIAPKLVSSQEGHFALPGYHLFLLPFLIFPATYALPAAARLSWEAVRAPSSEAAQSPIRFLLAWAGPIFIFFEFAPTKLAHYVLPAYPAIALLCGAGLAAMHGGRWRTAHPAGVVLYAVYGAVLVALMAAAATFMPGDLATDLRRAVSAALVGLGLLALSFTLLIMAPRPDVRAGVLIICALIFSFSLRERLLPEARLLNVSSEVVTALTRARLTPREDRPLWVVGYDELSIVFLTRSSIHLADPETAGANAQPGDALVVEGREMQRMSSALEVRGLRFEGREPPVRGLSLGRGERVALFVGRVAEPSEERAAGRQQSP